MDEKLGVVKEILKKYQQEHLLRFYEELSYKEQEKLLDQILSIDFENMEKLYNKTKIEEQAVQNNIEPVQYRVKADLPKEETDRYSKIGIQAIESGKIAVCHMAGGQGTRLGHNAPKGTFVMDINPPKTIFEIYIDKLKKIQKEYNVTLFYYIMTSQENNNDTVKFFEENNYFSYPKEKIIFFKQGQLPMMHTDGKLLMDSKVHIKEAADGNGGIFEAIYKNNVIEQMKQNNIEWLGIGNVDNILLNMVDPIYIGMAIDKKVKLATKTVEKVSPEEKVGVLCKIDGKPGVIEYTEISKEMSELRDEQGNLVYGQSYFGTALYNISLLEQIGDQKLPYHIALKKSNYISESGEEKTSQTPNAYKFEAFIFDSFKFADDILLLNVKREEEFAPVKNATGVDSPETAKQLYLNYMKNN